MRALKTTSTAAVSILVLLTATSCTSSPPPVCMELKAREASIRNMVARKVMPDFPAEAANVSAAGVAVAQVRLDENGTLTSVEVLQAPHPSIAQATIAAIKQWEFKFTKNEAAPECFNSKLTFYFVIEDGKPLVRDPKRFQKA